MFKILVISCTDKHSSGNLVNDSPLRWCIHCWLHCHYTHDSLDDTITSKVSRTYELVYHEFGCLWIRYVWKHFQRNSYSTVSVSAPSYRGYYVHLPFCSAAICDRGIDNGSIADWIGVAVDLLHRMDSKNSQPLASAHQFSCCCIGFLFHIFYLHGNFQSEVSMVSFMAILSGRLGNQRVAVNSNDSAFETIQYGIYLRNISTFLVCLFN